MKLSPLETIAMANQAIMNRRNQITMVSSAILKLLMMGLTPEIAMVKCNLENVDNVRWNAMVLNYFLNEGNV